MLHVADNGDLLHGIAHRERPLMVWSEQCLAALRPHFPHHICLTTKNLHFPDVMFDLTFLMDTTVQGSDTADKPKTLRAHLGSCLAAEIEMAWLTCSSGKWIACHDMVDHLKAERVLERISNEIPKAQGSEDGETWLCVSPILRMTSRSQAGPLSAAYAAHRAELLGSSAMP